MRDELSVDRHDPEAVPEGQDACGRDERALSRRTALVMLTIGAGAAAVGARTAVAQTPTGPVAPPEHHHQPAARFRPERRADTYFTDPDVLTVDPLFNSCRQPNAAIQRLWTGALWAEGPAWNAEGRYLVFSDIPNNRQMRWIEDDGRVTRVPHAVEQQQRQQLRLPGPAALLRAPDPARRPLRARRLDHRARRLASTASA